jgi:hypothetical protein
VATAQEVLQLREYVNEPDDTNGWTDERLVGYADAATNLHNAAAEVWGVKAGTYAGVVNMYESGSGRSLSDLFKQAKQMQEYHAALGRNEDLAVLDGPIIRTIRRQR